MQLKTLILSVALTVFSARSLVLDTPSVVVTGEALEVAFQAQPGDSDFTLQLENTLGPGVPLALVADVKPNLGSVTITFPCVPTNGIYQLEAANALNNSEIIAQTADFTVTQGPDC